MDDRKLVESKLNIYFTCCFVPAVILETTQHAYLLTVFFGLLNVSYNCAIPLFLKISSVCVEVPVETFPKILTQGTTRLKYESVIKLTILGISPEFINTSILFFLASLL